jgi:hypothetical protein
MEGYATSIGTLPGFSTLPNLAYYCDGIH